MKGMTVTLKPYPPSPFMEGDLMRYAGTKRTYILITKVAQGQDSWTITGKMGYKASPRSRLKHGKTPFSKIKMRIINKYQKK